MASELKDHQCEHVALRNQQQNIMIACSLLHDAYTHSEEHWLETRKPAACSQQAPVVKLPSSSPL